VKLIKKDFRG